MLSWLEHEAVVDFSLLGLISIKKCKKQMQTLVSHMQKSPGKKNV